MNPFDLLIEAPDTTAFFIILCNDVHRFSGPYRPENRLRNLINRTELRRGGNGRLAYALVFEIWHTLSSPNERGGRNFHSERTHVFTLYQDGTLTWWMLGESTVI